LAGVHVAGLVLAAGAGRRYGMPKALVPYEGSLLVERACRLLSVVCDPVYVVLGAAADEVLSRADLGRAEVTVNRDWDSGMGSSLRTGLNALATHPGGSRQDRQAGGQRPEGDSGGLPANRQSEASTGPVDAVLDGPVDVVVDAVVVHLVDLPGMTAAAIRRVATYASAEGLAVATYDGVRGHPVLLGRRHWAGVAESASGDQGARTYLAAHEVTEVECSDLADPTDLDYPPA